MAKPTTPEEALFFVANAGATLCNEHGEIALRILRETVERARVVGVLDAWADAHDCSTPEVTRLLNKSKAGRFRMWLASHAVFYGETRDSVRAAAAAAIEKGEV